MIAKTLFVISLLIILTGCAVIQGESLPSSLNNVLVCGPGIPVYSKYDLEIKACAVESDNQLDEFYIVIQGSLESIF